MKTKLFWEIAAFMLLLLAHDVGQEFFDSLWVRTLCSTPLWSLSVWLILERTRLLEADALLAELRIGEGGEDG